MKNFIRMVLNIFGVNIIESPDEFAAKLHLLDHQEYIEGSLQYVSSQGKVLFGSPVKFGKDVLHIHSQTDIQLYKEERYKVTPEFQSKLSVVKLVSEISAFDKNRAYTNKKEEIFAFLP